MKHMNLKRFASTALAGVLALSSAVPALAEDKSTVITGTYQATELSVTVPTTGSAIINPYGLPIDMEDGVSVLSGQQITTAAPLVISNQSKVDLKVTAVGTIADVDGSSALTYITTSADDVEVSQTPSPAVQPKNVFVQFEAFAAPDLDVETESDPTVTNPAFADLDKATPDLTLTFDDSQEVETTGDLVLRAGQDTVTQKGGAAYIRLSGAVAKKPTKSGDAGAIVADDWLETDGFKATIIYTFEPDEYSLPIELTASNETPSAGTFAPFTITTDALTGEAITDPAAQIEVSQTNSTNAGNEMVIDAVTASSWNNTSKVVTLNVSDAGDAADGDTIVVAVRITTDSGTVYKGTTSVTFGT